MTTLHDRASEIHKAIRWGGKMKAVFHLPRTDGTGGWHWWACKTDSVRGDMMIRDFQQYLVGTFTPDVAFEHLLETMAFEEKQRGVV